MMGGSKTVKKVTELKLVISLVSSNSVLSPVILCVRARARVCRRGGEFVCVIRVVGKLLHADTLKLNKVVDKCKSFERTYVRVRIRSRTRVRVRVTVRVRLRVRVRVRVTSVW